MLNEAHGLSLARAAFIFSGLTLSPPCANAKYGTLLNCPLIKPFKILAGSKKDSLLLSNGLCQKTLKSRELGKKKEERGRFVPSRKTVPICA